MVWGHYVRGIQKVGLFSHFLRLLAVPGGPGFETCSHSGSKAAKEFFVKKKFLSAGILGLALVFVFALAVTLVSCGDDEGNVNGGGGSESIPAELRGTWLRNPNSSSYSYIFTSNSFTYRWDNERFTISNISSVTEATNTSISFSADYPSGYSIRGTASNSNISRVVNGNEYTYGVFFNSDKSKIRVTGTGANSNLDYTKR